MRFQGMTANPWMLVQLGRESPRLTQEIKRFGRVVLLTHSSQQGHTLGLNRGCNHPVGLLLNPGTLFSLDLMGRGLGLVELEIHRPVEEHVAGYAIALLTKLFARVLPMRYTHGATVSMLRALVVHDALDCDTVEIGLLLGGEHFTPTFCRVVLCDMQPVYIPLNLVCS